MTLSNNRGEYTQVTSKHLDIRQRVLYPNHLEMRASEQVRGNQLADKKSV